MSAVRSPGERSWSENPAGLAWESQPASTRRCTGFQFNNRFAGGSVVAELAAEDRLSQLSGLKVPRAVRQLTDLAAGADFWGSFRSEFSRRGLAPHGRLRGTMPSPVVDNDQVEPVKEPVLPLDQIAKTRQPVVKEAYLLVVSGRLVVVTLVLLVLIVVGTFGPTIAFGRRFPVSWFSFGVGVLGGFVSLQQRLNKISDKELFHLRFSWINVLMLPVFGGISALLFYLITLSGIVAGDALPTYTVPGFSNPVTTDNLHRFFAETYPASGEDFAKLAIWAFAAGFSERLVPDTIRGIVGRVPGTSSESVTSDG